MMGGMDVASLHTYYLLAAEQTKKTSSGRSRWLVTVPSLPEDTAMRPKQQHRNHPATPILEEQSIDYPGYLAATKGPICRALIK